jgi:ATPase subunit of ABC transporter with duplicated ATPase domains
MAILLISHDRKLLSSTADRVVGLRRNGFQHSAGAFT